MTTVNIHEAKTHLSRLLELVEQGERVTIARAGRPIADLVRHDDIEIVFGTGKGTVRVEPGRDLDEPDEELLELFETSAKEPL
ncbi:MULTISPECIES: type II toxin-antitoxin system Phd/YefM family antitoxin [unclassified Luteococcus]|uniref:type II toxin-antitoxin system Phd/YefM family antitoxin n=1 Tax=unclassified Luteococcus TaxID=2639923 RepID=UPI00313B2DF9